MHRPSSPHINPPSCRPRPAACRRCTRTPRQIAVDPEDDSPSGEPGKVVGCIDIRLPRRQTGVHPTGVPLDDPAGCYILNVVVHEDRRGQGIGKALMREAMARATGPWDAQHLYTHVEADNEVGALRCWAGLRCWAVVLGCAAVLWCGVVFTRTGRQTRG